MAPLALRFRQDHLLPALDSPATAKTHANRAMVKLVARDRAQLLVIAYSSGLPQR